ncbi:MAG: hypothetical protein ACPG4T_23455, partial [Nannocystaceae bacterium]
VGACTPHDAILESTIPADMETHPSNAGVAIVGYQLDPSGLSATIDGQPVAVAVDELRSIVRLPPEPTAATLPCIRWPKIAGITGTVCSHVFATSRARHE